MSRKQKKKNNEEKRGKKTVKIVHNKFEARNVVKLEIMIN